MVNPKYLRDDLHSMVSHVTEECGEILAAIGKMNRWGPDSVNPEDNSEMTNMEWVYNELCDGKLVISRLILRIESMYGFGKEI